MHLALVALKQIHCNVPASTLDGDLVSPVCAATFFKMKIIYILHFLSHLL